MSDAINIPKPFTVLDVTLKDMIEKKTDLLELPNGAVGFLLLLTGTLGASAQIGIQMHPCEPIGAQILQNPDAGINIGGPVASLPGSLSLAPPGNQPTCIPTIINVLNSFCPKFFILGLVDTDSGATISKLKMTLEWLYL